MNSEELKNKIIDLENVIEHQRTIIEQLKISEERYHAILEQSHDILFEWDFITDTMTFSNKYSSLFSFPSMIEHMSTNPLIREWIHPHDTRIFEEWVHNTYQLNSSLEVIFRCLDKNQDYIWIGCRSTGMSDPQGNIIKAVGVLTNIKEERMKIENLTMISQIDPITKILNKDETIAKIDRLLGNHPIESGTLFMIEIDNFEKAFQNEPIQKQEIIFLKMSQEIQKTFRKKDVIGRYSDKCFVTYMHGQYDESIVLEKASSLIKALHIPYQEKNLSVSIGISHYPFHGDTFEQLYKIASCGLNQAKDNGGNQYHICK